MNFHEQGLKMQKLSTTAFLVSGEKAYGISLSWFGAWKEAVGYDGEEPTNISPGPINNNDLFINGQFNSAKIEGTDFIILTHLEWHYLYKWYGGGPELTFPIEYDVVHNKNIAIVHYMKAKIYFNNQYVSFRLSPCLSIGKILSESCKYFQVNPKDYSLYDYWDGKKGQKYEINQYILELCFADPQPILLEKTNSSTNVFSDTKIAPVNFSLPSSGITGLFNLGNTCFLNSGLQCLLHSKPLIDYFIKDSWKTAIVKENNLGTGGQITLSFALLVNEFWNGTQTSIAPRTLRSIIVQHAPHFFGYQQQDAQELVITLLDLIHEDLNQSRRKNPLQFQQNNLLNNPNSSKSLNTTSNINTNNEKKDKSNENQDENKNNINENKNNINESKDNINESKDNINENKNNINENKNNLNENKENQNENKNNINENKDNINENKNNINENKDNINENKDNINENKDNENSEEPETPEKAWRRHLSHNNSPIVEIFHGQLRSRLHCPNCGSDEIVYDPFVSLSLPVPPPSGPDVNFLFVPFDASQKRIVFTVSNSIFSRGSFSLESVVSQQVGRSINLIYALVDGDYIQWIFTPIQKDGYILVAFEVEDRAHYYSAIYLSIKKHGFFSDSSIPIEGPFLLPLPNENPSDESLQIAVETKFAYLWSKNENSNQNNSPEFKNGEREQNGQNSNLSKSPKTTKTNVPLDRHKKIINTMEPLTGKQKGLNITFEKTGPLNRCMDLPCVASNSIHAILNSEAVQSEKGFQWNLFVKNFTKAPKVGNSSSSLSDCFEEFRKPTTLDKRNQWYCPKCHTFVCANKKMDLYKPPQCLLIHFKRFIATSYGYKKNGSPINYPDILDLSPYVLDPNSLSLKYRLYGVSFHLGEMSGGHYLAACYGWPQKKWYFFDDSSVTECSHNTLHNSSAYMLFYQRIDE